MRKNTTKPLSTRAAGKTLEDRPAKKRGGVAVERRFHVAARKKPKVRTDVKRVRRDGADTWEVVVEVDKVAVDRRPEPMPMKGRASRARKRRVPEEKLAEQLTPFIPDHLAFSALPKDTTRGFRSFRRELSRRRTPTTVFGTDNRRTFRDTSYPWSTVGLVETNRGAGSGVMIGPRHMLTVSHVIDWNAPPGFAANWVRFTPSYYDGNAPFGEAFGIHIYWFVQEDGDGFITGNEGDFDYAVVVLDSRMGESTGWMGARGYDDDWDSLAAWSHMGYPTDLNSGQRPTWQGGFRMDGTDAAAQSILHRADVFPGQSGGPMFGFWAGEVGPRAVAVQSWENTGNNGASGSEDMRDLVARARTEFA